MKGRVVELVNSIANLYERKHGVYSAKDIADLKNRFQGTVIKGEDLVEELLLNWQSIEKLIIDKQPIKDAKEINHLKMIWSWLRVVYSCLVFIHMRRLLRIF